MLQLFHNLIKTWVSLTVLALLGFAIWNYAENRGVSTLQKNTTKKFNKFKESSEEGIFSPVIRLLRNDAFICSGAVISDEYAVTAAHCVSDANGRLINTLKVQDETRTYTVNADVVGLNHRLDYALLSGNFRSYKKFKINENSTMDRHSLEEKEPSPAPSESNALLTILGVKNAPVFISCGFPMGSAKKFCTEFSMLGDYNFQIVGTGTLYPGMSGGPVYDPKTNTVFAVNSAVTGQYAIVSPLIGILSCFDVD